MPLRIRAAPRALLLAATVTPAIAQSAAAPTVMRDGVAAAIRAPDTSLSTDAAAAIGLGCALSDAGPSRIGALVVDRNISALRRPVFTSHQGKLK